MDFGAAFQSGGGIDATEARLMIMATGSRDRETVVARLAEMIEGKSADHQGVAGISHEDALAAARIIEKTWRDANTSGKDYTTSFRSHPNAHANVLAFDAEHHKLADPPAPAAPRPATPAAAGPAPANERPSPTPTVKRLIADHRVSGSDARELIRLARQDAGLPSASRDGTRIVPSLTNLLVRAGMPPTEARRAAQAIFDAWNGAVAAADYDAAYGRATEGRGYVDVTVGQTPIQPQTLPPASSTVQEAYTRLQNNHPLSVEQADAVAERARAREGIPADSMDARRLKSAVQTLLLLEVSDVTLDKASDMASAVVKQSRYGETERAVAANPERNRTWSLADVRANPNEFLRHAPQIDGNTGTAPDRTACAVMSLVGGMLRADPGSVQRLAQALQSSAGSQQFPALQNSPFREAIARIASGSFSPADLSQLGQGLFVASVPAGATGTIDGDLFALIGRLVELGVTIPDFELQTHGTPDLQGTHVSAYAAGTGFDPWPYPGSNGQARVTLGAVSQRESAESSGVRIGLNQPRQMLDRIVIRNGGRQLTTERFVVAGVAAPSGSGPLMTSTYQLEGGRYRRTAHVETAAAAQAGLQGHLDHLRPYYAAETVPLDRVERKRVAPTFGNLRASVTDTSE